MLYVKQNKVLNEKGEKVRLYGVNICGLEWDSKGYRIIESVNEAFKNWNCNLIRLPLSQDRWFGKAEEQADAGESYRKIVGDVIKIASESGKYIDIDLHWSNMGEWGKNISQHYMPDMLSIDFWIDIAKRYANNPAVLFGLYNEPHDISWKVWRDGGKVDEIINKGKEDEAIVSYETPGHQRLINEIRKTGAKNIIIAGGIDWAYDLRGIAKNTTTGECYALDDPQGNGIIYDSHIYTIKEHDGVNHDTKVLCITQDHPVLIGEIGISNREGEYGAANRPTWLADMCNWMDKHDLHWTGWCFHPSAGPCMILDWDYNPTSYHGAILKERLLSYANL